MSKTEDYPIEGQVLDEDRRNRNAYVASIFSSQIRQSIERTHSKQLVCGLDPFRNRACKHVLRLPPGRPGRYSTKFNSARLRPEVQPFTILTEKVPLQYTFY